MNNFIAETSIMIEAPIQKVWEALTKPEIIKEYMFGTNVVSDWQVGSSIVWKGEWQGKPYEDKGKILRFEKNRVLEYTHFSPLSGKTDTPENYHKVSITLVDDGKQTTVTLSQDGNKTKGDQKHSEEIWKMMLEGFKKLLEK